MVINMSEEKRAQERAYEIFLELSEEEFAIEMAATIFASILLTKADYGLLVRSISAIISAVVKPEIHYKLLTDIFHDLTMKETPSYVS